MKRLMISVLTVALMAALTSVCEAKTDRELTYRSSQIWSSAVRFLRVDQQFKILEKDKDSSYMLFEYRDGVKTYSSSMEMVNLIRNGKKYVRVRISIPAMPSYVEKVLVDKFLRKLKDEYGPQPEPLLIDPAPMASPQDGSGSNSDGAGQGVSDDADEDDLETTEEDLDDSVEEE